MAPAIIATISALLSARKNQNAKTSAAQKTLHSLADYVQENNEKTDEDAEEGIMKIFNK